MGADDEEQQQGAKANVAQAPSNPHHKILERNVSHFPDRRSKWKTEQSAFNRAAQLWTHVYPTQRPVRDDHGHTVGQHEFRPRSYAEMQLRRLLIERGRVIHTLLQSDQADFLTSQQ